MIQIFVLLFWYGQGIRSVTRFERGQSSSEHHTGPQICPSGFPYETATFPPKIPTRGLRTARQLWHSVHPVLQTFHLLMLLGSASSIKGSVSSIIWTWTLGILTEPDQANTGILSQLRHLPPPVICLPIHYLPIILPVSLLTASLINHICQ